MSQTIKEVLERLRDYNLGFLNDDEIINLSLSLIQEIINECKPINPTRYEDMDNKTDYHKRGYKLGIDQYQTNLEKRLK